MMRKALLVVIGGISLASMLSTAEAKRNCHKPRCEREEQVCAPKCAPEVCCTPAQQVCGVLCDVKKAKKIVRVDDECCSINIPCVKTRCEPQPDKIEKVWKKREYCVPQPDKIEIEWYCEEICVPQPDKEVMYCEESCRKDMRPCYKEVDCIEYVPKAVNVTPPCERPASSSCERSMNNDMDMDMDSK